MSCTWINRSPSKEGDSKRGRSGDSSDWHIKFISGKIQAQRSSRLSTAENMHTYNAYIDCYTFRKESIPLKVIQVRITRQYRSLPWSSPLRSIVLWHLISSIPTIQYTLVDHFDSWISCFPSTKHLPQASTINTLIFSASISSRVLDRQDFSTRIWENKLSDAYCRRNHTGEKGQ